MQHMLNISIQLNKEVFNHISIEDGRRFYNLKPNLISGYIGEIENGYLVPGTLGMGLVEGYESVELPLAYPELRAGLERDLKLICTGERVPDDVLKEQMEKYKEVYRVITSRIEAMDASLANRY